MSGRCEIRRGLLIAGEERARRARACMCGTMMGCLHRASETLRMTSPPSKISPGAAALLGHAPLAAMRQGGLHWHVQGLILPASPKGQWLIWCAEGSCHRRLRRLQTRLQKRRPSRWSRSGWPPQLQQLLVVQCLIRRLCPSSTQSRHQSRRQSRHSSQHHPSWRPCPHHLVGLQSSLRELQKFLLVVSGSPAKWLDRRVRG